MRFLSLLFFSFSLAVLSCFFLEAPLSRAQENVEMTPISHPRNLIAQRQRTPTTPPQSDRSDSRNETDNEGMIRMWDNPSNIDDATSYEGSFRQAVLTIVNFFLLFLGLISVVMVIYGGFLYVTSAGGDGTEKAKKILLYAAIGIVVILVSFALVNTLLGAGDVNSGAEN